MLSTLPNFVLYIASAIALFSAFVYIYKRITPYDEIDLIRGGNISAAVALAGTMLGLAWPLASVIAHSMGIFDVIIWGSIAMGVQLLVWKAVDYILVDLKGRIERDQVAAGIFLGATSFAVGVINAACLTY